MTFSGRSSAVHPAQPVLHDVADLVGEAPGRTATTAGFVDASSGEWPSACCRPSPVSVVRPAVAPMRKPRVIWSAAAQIESPVRWKPNIE